MAHQVRSFVVRVTTDIKLYQLVALGLALSAAIYGAPIHGGGGN